MGSDFVIAFKQLDGIKTFLCIRDINSQACLNLIQHMLHIRAELMDRRCLAAGLGQFYCLGSCIHNAGAL